MYIHSQGVNGHIHKPKSALEAFLRDAVCVSASQPFYLHTQYHGHLTALQCNYYIFKLSILTVKVAKTTVEPLVIRSFFDKSQDFKSSRSLVHNNVDT